MKPGSRVLVVDVEATCWRGHPPPGERREIIEIGVCELDIQRARPGPAYSILVKPQRSHISEFCTRLTSITPEMAAQGILFNEACTILRRDYRSCELIWSSWGKDDRKMFEEQCATLRVSYPFSPQHIDLRRLFAMVTRQDKSVKLRYVGLLKALELAGLQYRGNIHRGVDDAYNTARLLAMMVQQHGTGILQA